MGNGSAADARAKDRAPRDDSAFDLIDVPATVVCAACGDPGCPGCAIEEPTNQSGVVAIIPWERPGVGFWRRLWQTSTLATVHARTFFGAIPDGDVSTALSFALVCETLAVSGLGLGAGVIALICLPSLPMLLVEDANLRSSVVRGVGFGGFVLVLAMVSLHAIHGAALDAAARRFGGRRSRPGLRFGLYACGWDLITLPFGLLATALISGLGAARAAAPLGLTAPRQASEAYLIGHHGLGPDSVRRAARLAAYFTAVPFLCVIALAALGVVLALR
jgi:hypothetical protein